VFNTEKRNLSMFPARPPNGRDIYYWCHLNKCPPHFGLSPRVVPLACIPVVVAWMREGCIRIRIRCGMNMAWHGMRRDGRMAAGLDMTINGMRLATVYVTMLWTLDVVMITSGWYAASGQALNTPLSLAR